MKFFERGASVKHIDDGLKNKWRWEWLDEEKLGRKYSSWAKKFDAPGGVFCIVCNSGLQYASSSEADRIASQKAILCSFISEHALPFSLGPHLIELAQKLSCDVGALNKLSMCRKTVTYTLTHGVAKSMNEELKRKIKAPYPKSESLIQ